MFDHVVFGVSDYAAAREFFLKALKPLGVAVVSEGPLGVELCRPDSNSSLCIRRAEEKSTHLHLAFKAENRRQVEGFYCAALKAGGKDNGAPGLRPKYHANYYAAFVIGPDGHNIEVFAMNPRPDSSLHRRTPREVVCAHWMVKNQSLSSPGACVRRKRMVMAPTTAFNPKRTFIRDCWLPIEEQKQ